MRDALPLQMLQDILFVDTDEIAKWLAVYNSTRRSYGLSQGGVSRSQWVACIDLSDRIDLARQ